MNHREKLRLARKMADTDKSLWFTDEKGNRHRKKGVGIFQGDAWTKRKIAIANRLKVVKP